MISLLKNVKHIFQIKLTLTGLKVSKEKATQVKQIIQHEEINLKILAKEGRLGRYRNTTKQYRQKNKTKQTNKKQRAQSLEAVEYTDSFATEG